jgi:UDP-N-acetylmuramate dehydrogenase
MSLSIKQTIPLAPLTTIHLGGNAKEYIACESDEDIVAALSYAKEKNMRAHVLGGGSNTIFSDNGFDGLVIHIQTKGITTTNEGDSVLLAARAGEDWDNVVQYAISRNLTGIECLSGIPGSCGGTPFQNVGAYGQEVAQTIAFVDAIDRTTQKPVRFTNEECAFNYRTSRFKEGDRDKYVITSVSFRLIPNGTPAIRYGELHDALGDSIEPGSEGLARIRTTVLGLRKKKSMLVDPADPNSISCGSFFTNPILPATQLAEIQKNTSEEIPSYEAGTDKEGIALVKLSAAWLVEHAGFTKGTIQGNVGISQNHSLAVINKGGTTEELLSFAKEIQSTVQEKFNITLALEPLVIA